MLKLQALLVSGGLIAVASFFVPMPYSAVMVMIMAIIVLRVLFKKDEGGEDDAE